MEQLIRDIQLKLLEAFGRAAKTFALAGGTALELFYLNHRFSRDLDFFSPQYDPEEISGIISRLGAAVGSPLRLEDEFVGRGRAKMRFYAIKVKGSSSPLKIDFVEDVFLKKPAIKKFKGVPVYSAENIYFLKIIALTGTYSVRDEVGREVITGRREARDVVDVYYLSKKIMSLHRFLQKLERPYQRGMVQWHRSYSRRDVKLGLLDLDIYDKKFDASEMIHHLDGEIKKFMSGVIK